MPKDTLQNGEELSCDSAEMSVLEPFMLDKDEGKSGKKKSNDDPFKQYGLDLGKQNAPEVGKIGEVVAENPELLMAL